MAVTADNLLLIAYRSRRDEFHARVALFGDRTLDDVIGGPGGHPAMVTVGTGPSGAVLCRLQSLAKEMTTRTRRGAPAGWVLLTVDPSSRSVIHQLCSSTEVAKRELKVEIERRQSTGAAALVRSAVLDLLDPQLQEQLVSADASVRDDVESGTLEAANRAGVLEIRKEMLKRIRTISNEDIAKLRVSATKNVSQLGKDLRRAGKIFGVRHGKSWRYPRFQFGQDGEPYREVAQLVAALGKQATGWDIVQWFMEDNSDLGGRSPLEAWRKDRPGVVIAAQNARWFERD